VRRIVPILIALLSLSAQAHAAPPKLYEVQVLVFANHLPQLDGQEYWGQEKIVPIKDFNQALSASHVLPVGSQLAIAQSVLSTNSHYTVLAARSWVQNMVSLRTTKPIRIQSAIGGTLTGVIRVFQWRLIHVAVDLHYTPTPGILSTTPPPVYQLMATRPVVLRDTNYFDHPKIGVLVRVVPYTGPIQGPTSSGQ